MLKLKIFSFRVKGEGEFHDNIYLIPSSRHLANLSKLMILSEGDIRREAGRKERLLKLRLEAIKEMDFDYVVIDTPPMLGDELIMSLVASSRILIPTQAQDYSIDGLEELLILLRLSRIQRILHLSSQLFQIL